MAEISSQTPVTSVKTPGTINTLLRSFLRGTPYRTPDRRRFGPVGKIVSAIKGYITCRSLSLMHLSVFSWRGYKENLAANKSQPQGTR